MCGYAVIVFVVVGVVILFSYFLLLFFSPCHHFLCEVIPLQTTAVDMAHKASPCADRTGRCVSQQMIIAEHPHLVIQNLFWNTEYRSGVEEIIRFF